jgi:hypothetical protein
MAELLDSITEGEGRELAPYLTSIMNRYGIQAIGQFGYSTEASIAAIKVLSELLAYKPKSAGILFILSFLYTRQHRYVDALDAAKRLEVVQPESLRGVYLQALCYNSLVSAFYATESDSPEWIAQLQEMEQQRLGKGGFSIAP